MLGDERGPDAAAVCDRLLAVQAQDLRSARLAVRARTDGLAIADIDRALVEGALVIGWLNRGTLHLVRTEDYWWLHALTTPPLFTGNARRLAQTGVAPSQVERGVATIAQALRDEGPLVRDQLRDRVQAAGVPTEGQALVHLLMLACLHGIAVRGPMVGGRHAYVDAETWIGPAHPVGREASLAEFARRYLRGHAPADERDLAKWAGLPLGDARAGLEAIAAELIRRDDGLLELRGQDGDGRPRPCLLDRWDPVLVGWRSREAMLAHYPSRDLPETHYRPFAYVRGEAVATWGLREGKAKVDTPFGAVASADLRALIEDAGEVERFLIGDR